MWLKLKAKYSVNGCAIRSYQAHQGLNITCSLEIVYHDNKPEIHLAVDITSFFITTNMLATPQ